jgi:hypothetical protein
MAMRAGIRTPREVIALVLEDAGMSSEEIRALSLGIEARLEVALKSVPGTIIMLGEGGLSWGHFVDKKAKKNWRAGPLSE